MSQVNENDLQQGVETPVDDEETQFDQGFSIGEDEAEAKGSAEKGQEQEANSEGNEAAGSQEPAKADEGKQTNVQNEQPPAAEQPQQPQQPYQQPGGYQQPQQGGYQQPQGPYTQPPGSNYPRPGFAGDDGSSDLTKAWIFGAIGFICCPIIFSVLGIYFAAQAKNKGNPTGQTAMIFCIVSLVAGIGLSLLLNASRFARF